MDSKLIPAKLIELNTAHNDRTGKQNGSPTLFIDARDGGAFWTSMHFAGLRSQSFRSETPDELFSKAFKFIADLPSEAEQNLTEFQGDLAKLIDKGREYNIPLDFVNPLIATSKKLAENVITHHKDYATDDEINGVQS